LDKRSCKPIDASSRGVDAWAEPEPHVPRGDARARQLRHFLERAHARPGARREDLEPVTNQNAVGSGERHHVGDGGERDQIEQLLEVGLRPFHRREEARLAQRLPQRHAQRERHPAGAEPLRRVVTAGLQRVEHGHRGRHRLGHGVVVDDDHLEPQGVGLADLGVRGDAAVERHQHLRTLGRQALDGGDVEPVAFAKPMRNVRAHLEAHVAQERREQRRGAHAVDVVVAPQGDALLAADRADKPLDRGRQALHAERIRQARQRVIEEALRSLGRGVAPVREHPRRNRMKPQLPHEPGRRDAIDIGLRPHPRHWLLRVPHEGTA
jgi:hypothetical protein